MSARTAVVSSASTGYGIFTTFELLCFWMDTTWYTYMWTIWLTGAVYRWTSAVSASVRRLRTSVSTRFVLTRYLYVHPNGQQQKHAKSTRDRPDVLTMSFLSTTVPLNPFLLVSFLDPFVFHDFRYVLGAWYQLWEEKRGSDLPEFSR